MKLTKDDLDRFREVQDELVKRIEVVFREVAAGMREVYDEAHKQHPKVHFPSVIDNGVVLQCVEPNGDVRFTAPDPNANGCDYWHTITYQLPGELIVTVDLDKAKQFGRDQVSGSIEGIVQQHEEMKRIWGKREDARLAQGKAIRGRLGIDSWDQLKSE